MIVNHLCGNFPDTGYRITLSDLTCLFGEWFYYVDKEISRVLLKFIVLFYCVVVTFSAKKTSYVIVRYIYGLVYEYPL